MITQEQIITVFQFLGWTIRPDLSMFCNDKHGCFDGKLPNTLTLDTIYEAKQKLSKDQQKQWIIEALALFPLGATFWDFGNLSAAQEAQVLVSILQRGPK